MQHLHTRTDDDRGPSVQSIDLSVLAMHYLPEHEVDSGSLLLPQRVRSESQVEFVRRTHAATPWRAFVARE
jgi:hypothetical protein